MIPILFSLGVNITTLSEAIFDNFRQVNLAQTSPEITPRLIQEDLYFVRKVGTTEAVTEQQFRQFLGNEITSRFPTRLTVYDANRQVLDSSGRLIREPSQLVSLIVEDTGNTDRAIDEMINLYRQKFQQDSVLRYPFTGFSEVERDKRRKI
jgi:hypothetical protein